MIFFAYIGFDAVSTSAQEANRPARDMPVGILGSLAICTVRSISLSLVLTGPPKPIFPAGIFSGEDSNKNLSLTGRHRGFWVSENAARDQ